MVCIPVFAQCLIHPVPAVLCAVGQLCKHGLVVKCSMFCLVNMTSKLATVLVPESTGQVPV